MADEERRGLGRGRPHPEEESDGTIPFEGMERREFDPGQFDLGGPRSQDKGMTVSGSVDVIRGGVGTHEVSVEEAAREWQKYMGSDVPSEVAFGVPELTGGIDIASIERQPIERSRMVSFVEDHMVPVSDRDMNAHLEAQGVFMGSLGSMTGDEVLRFREHQRNKHGGEELRGDLAVARFQENFADVQTGAEYFALSQLYRKKDAVIRSMTTAGALAQLQAGDPSAWEKAEYTQEEAMIAKQFLESDKDIQDVQRWHYRMENESDAYLEKNRDRIAANDILGGMAQKIIGAASMGALEVDKDALLSPRDLSVQQEERDTRSGTVKGVAVAADVTATVIGIVSSGRAVRASMQKTGMSPARSQFVANAISTGLVSEAGGGSFAEGMTQGVFLMALGNRLGRMLKGLDPTKAGRLAQGTGDGASTLIAGQLMGHDFDWNEALLDFAMGFAQGVDRNVGIMEEYKLNGMKLAASKSNARRLEILAEMDAQVVEMKRQVDVAGEEATAGVMAEASQPKAGGGGEDFVPIDRTGRSQKALRKEARERDVEAGGSRNRTQRLLERQDRIDVEQSRILKGRGLDAEGKPVAEVEPPGDVPPEFKGQVDKLEAKRRVDAGESKNIGAARASMAFEDAKREAVIAADEAAIGAALEDVSALTGGAPARSAVPAKEATRPRAAVKARPALPADAGTPRVPDVPGKVGVSATEAGPAPRTPLVGHRLTGPDGDVSVTALRDGKVFWTSVDGAESGAWTINEYRNLSDDGRVTLAEQARISAVPGVRGTPGTAARAAVPAVVGKPAVEALPPRGPQPARPAVAGIAVEDALKRASEGHGIDQDLLRSRHRVAQEVAANARVPAATAEGGRVPMGPDGKPVPGVVAAPAVSTKLDALTGKPILRITASPPTTGVGGVPGPLLERTPSEVAAATAAEPDAASLAALTAATDKKDTNLKTAMSGGGAWKRAWDTVASGTRQFPRLTAVAENLGLAASKSSNNTVAGQVGARLMGERVLRKHGLLGMGTGKRLEKFGDAMHEDHDRALIAAYRARAAEARLRAKAAKTEEQTDWHNAEAMKRDWEANQLALATLVGTDGFHFKNDAEFQEFVKDPKNIAAAQDWQKFWDEFVEPMHQEQTGKWGPRVGDDTSGLHMGARINRFQVTDLNAAVPNQRVIGGNVLGTSEQTTMRANMSEGAVGGKAPVSPFSGRAIRSNGGYITNPMESMANTLSQRVHASGKLELIDGLVAEGHAVWSEKGATRPEFGGEGSVEIPLESRGPGQPSRLWVRKTLAGEVQQGLKMSPVPHFGSPTDLFQGINVLAVQSLADNTSNIIAGITRPMMAPFAGFRGLGRELHRRGLRATDAPVGANKAVGFALGITGIKFPVVFGQLIADIWRGSHVSGRRFAQLEQSFDLAKSGAFRSGALETTHGQEGFGSKSTAAKVWSASPPVAATRLIRGLVAQVGREFDEASRLLMDDVGKRLQNDGLMPKGAARRRDWVNQLGNYNRYAQGAATRQMVGSGLFSFQTAATRRFAGISRFFGGGDLGDVGFRERSQVLLETLSGIAGMTTVIGGLNLITTGEVWGREGVPVGSFDTGSNDERGRPIHFRLAEMMGYGDVLKFMGVIDFATAKRRGLNDAEAWDHASKMIKAKLVRPFSSPVSNTVTVAMTGDTIHGFDLTPSVGPDESQAGSSIGSSIYHLTPYIPVGLMTMENLPFVPSWSYEWANGLTDRHRREGDTFMAILGDQAGIMAPHLGMSDFRLKTYARDRRWARMNELGGSIQRRMGETPSADRVPLLLRELGKLKDEQDRQMLVDIVLRKIRQLETREAVAANE